MEGWSLSSGSFRALELVGSTSWDCSGLSWQQAALCQYLSALAIRAWPWPVPVAVGPAEGKGLSSREGPSGQAGSPSYSSGHSPIRPTLAQAK